ncbi:MAG: hypothetical protein KQI62_17150 [Deltaproteobacteria bacterium]|nr:hypothetical protein [Deltaproteobacteria bacterium]
MDFFKIFFLTPGQFVDLINSNIFYIYAVPICLILESGITYIYLKKIKTYPSIAIKKNTVMTFWAYMIIKMFLFSPVYFFTYIAAQTDRPWGSAGWYMIVYYLYSMRVCFAFVVYLAKKLTSIFSGKKRQEGDNTSDGDMLERAILYDVSGKIQAMYDTISPTRGGSGGDISWYLVLANLVLVSGIIYLLSGSFDSHTLDKVEPWVRYQWAGLLALLAVPGSVFILRKHRKADLERFSSTNRKAAPQTTAPQTPAAPPAPAPPTERKP